MTRHENEAVNCKVSGTFCENRDSLEQLFELVRRETDLVLPGGKVTGLAQKLPAERGER